MKQFSKMNDSELETSLEIHIEAVTSLLCKQITKHLAGPEEITNSRICKRSVQITIATNTDEAQLRWL